MTAFEQGGKELAEMPVDNLEGFQQAGPAFTRQLIHSLAQAVDGGEEVIALALHLGDLTGQFLGFFIGA